MWQIVDIPHAQRILARAAALLKNGSVRQQEKARFWKALAEAYIKAHSK